MRYERYGLCHGGPADGHYEGSQEDTLLVYANPSVPLGADASTIIRCERHRYLWAGTFWEYDGLRGIEPPLDEALS